MTLTDQRHQKVNTRELVRVFFSEINQYNEKINAKSKSLYTLQLHLKDFS